MDDKKRIRIFRNTLDTILLEAKEPIIKAYAQSALSETIEEKKPVETNSHCKKHNWFGVAGEVCPLCKKYL